ncbi:MAG: cell wall hydrolase [Eubacteriales bacterium]|jgi:N-acetylmuramoyl-L-alanine amidase|nr:hypothetical protein [Clostridiales bacterium]
MRLTPLSKKYAKRHDSFSLNMFVAVVTAVVIIFIASYLAGAQFRDGDIPSAGISDDISSDDADDDLRDPDSYVDSSENHYDNNFDVIDNESGAKDGLTDNATLVKDDDNGVFYEELDNGTPHLSSPYEDSVLSGRYEELLNKIKNGETIKSTEDSETSEEKPNTTEALPETTKQTPEVTTRPAAETTSPPETTATPPKTESNNGKKDGGTSEVYINGEKQDFCAVDVGGVIFVPFKAFVSALDSTLKFKWNSETRTLAATSSDNSMNISVGDGNCYVQANGRYFYTKKNIYINKNDLIMAPAELVAKAFLTSYSVSDGKVNVGAPGGYIEKGETYYDSDNLYWLSHIINAESGNEPMKGKLAVGAVIINRTKDSHFPSTIKDVIFDNSDGIQFIPAYTGSIYNEPNTDSIIAAKMCLEGYIIDKTILYFSISGANSWASRHRQFVFTISGHDFYA